MAIFNLPLLNSAALRARIGKHRTNLYLRSEKLRAILVQSGSKKILFSEKPDWANAIRNGFNRLDHRVEFGAITEDSFRKYDIVVPLTLDALEAARRHCPEGPAYPLPAAETVRLCDDKYAFNQALIKAGFEQYIPRIAQGPMLKPPYILKKRTGWWGSDCYFIGKDEDEKTHLDLIADPEYFCQEFIPGTTEFATHILFVKGRIVKALNIKYEFATGTPIKGQDTEVFKAVHRCPYLRLFARMLRAIQYEGLCCANYKVTGGQPFLLEINPRFGGSLSPYFFAFVRHLR